MSKLSELHSDLETIRQIMAPGSPAQAVEERIDRLITELDDLCVLVTDDATADLVTAQNRLLGTMVNRCGTLVRLVLARNPVRHAA